LPLASFLVLAVLKRATLPVLRASVTSLNRAQRSYMQSFSHLAIGRARLAPMQSWPIHIMGLAVGTCMCRFIVAISVLNSTPCTQLSVLALYTHKVYYIQSTTSLPSFCAFPCLAESKLVSWLATIWLVDSNNEGLVSKNLCTTHVHVARYGDQFGIPQRIIVWSLVHGLTGLDLVS
jgi:hypothetical protein